MANKTKAEKEIEEKAKAKAEEMEIAAVVGDDTVVPTVEVEKTVTEPVVEPTAIVPNVVKEINPDTLNAVDAPQILTSKSKNAKRVEVICDGHLGVDLLKKGDITDKDEYVALLKTGRGQSLVREV